MSYNLINSKAWQYNEGTMRHQLLITNDMQPAEQHGRSVHGSTLPSVGVACNGFRTRFEIAGGELTGSVDLTTVTTVGLAVSVDLTTITAVGVPCVYGQI